MSNDYELMCNQTVQALLAALELRDPETAGHCQRVAELAVRLGKEIEID